MPSLKLEGETLGEKRRHFNKLVADAVASKHYELTPIDYTDSDIDNLLKIEIACKTRNVDYVIEVMKSKDMLYASTAIKKSTWLITDPQYANIINPEYLHTQLKPYMTTKAFNKLMLHIRLNLKDESRVATFYEYLKDSYEASKWLQNCSLSYLDALTHCFAYDSLLIRLYKKSIVKGTDSEFIKDCRRDRICLLLYMLKSCTEDVMDIIENATYAFYPKMGKKKSEFLMKTRSQRVLDNFDKYINSIDISVVAKYMNKKDIIAFLCKYTHLYASDIYSYYEVLKHLIKNMEQAERVELLQKYFINQTEKLFINKNNMTSLNGFVRTYQWYEFFPFDLAFLEIKNLILKENLPSELSAMLSVLISSAKTNTEHVKSLLMFVIEEHMNIPVKFKIEFVNNLLLNVSTHNFDEETWNILDQLFHSMDVYVETENDVQLCRESIILRKVLNDEPVPDILEKNMCMFTSFKNVVITFTEEEINKLCIYVIKSVIAKIKGGTFCGEADVGALALVKYCKKDIIIEPFILGGIKELIKLKQDNKWIIDMSCFYNMKRSWRKYMIEESLSLSLCEETCLNALKHKPQLLTRHDKQIHMLRTNDAVSLRRVLAKLRVFWPNSLAPHWTEAYMKSLDGSTGHKAVVKGLFVLLSQSQVINLAQKYANENFKANCYFPEHHEFNIRKNIAKQLHITRPLVPLYTVYWYAKGDYAQYVVPSHNAILSNLGAVDSFEYIHQNQNVPLVFLKFVLNQAFIKFKMSEVINLFSNMWKSAKDPTTRSVIYEYIFNRMTDCYYERLENDLWELLNIFLDDLRVDGESTNIYKKLIDIDAVPYYKQAMYYMKSYRYLASLPDGLGCDKYINKLFTCANRTLIGGLDNDFVVNIILSPTKIQFRTSKDTFIESFATFVLNCDNEEDQLQRYKKIEAAIEETFRNWEISASYRQNYKTFLEALAHLLVTDYNKEIPIPVKLFTEIQYKMQNCLSMLENYELYTSWSLTTAYIKLLHELSARTTDRRTYNYWKVPSFGQIVLQYLKEDTEKYSPMIHTMFASALDKMFKMLSLRDFVIMDNLRNMLNGDYVIHTAYLVVSKIMSQYPLQNKTKYLQTQILKKFKTNLSKAVQVQFYNDFRDCPEIRKLYMSI